jgi:hypothetical protein
MKNYRAFRVALVALLGLSLHTSALEVGTNCIAVACEVMEGKCCDRSDLELKIVLADNCGKSSDISSAKNRLGPVLRCQHELGGNLQEEELLHRTVKAVPGRPLQQQRF